MKKKILNYRYSLTLLLFLVTLSACSKDEGTTPEPEPAPPELSTEPVATATISWEGAQDVVKFTAISEKEYSEAWDDERQYPAQIENEVLTLGFVSEIKSNGDVNGAISIIIHDYNGTGTYTIKGAGMEEGNFAIYQPIGTTEFEDWYTTATFEPANGDLIKGSGTVSITEDADGKIKGTFTLELHNSNGDLVTVSDGEFGSSLTLR